MRNFRGGGRGKALMSRPFAESRFFDAEDAEDFAEERKEDFSANLCEDRSVLCV